MLGATGGVPGCEGMTVGRAVIGCCAPEGCWGIVCEGAPTRCDVPVAGAGAPTCAGICVAMGGATGGAAWVSAGVCDGGADGVSAGVVEVSVDVVCPGLTPGTWAGVFTPCAPAVDAATTAAARRVRVEMRIVVS